MGRAMTDYPLEDLVESANKIIATGGTVYQKWTCEACGERVVANEANVFHTSMTHEDCPSDAGHVTLTPKGNYLVIAAGSACTEVLKQVLRRKGR
jgi:hypothetical protein